MRRDAVEIASSELLNRRHMQGIEGKAIAVGMDRPVPWKSPVEHGGAWFRNSGTPAGLKPVRRDAVEIASSELLNRRHMQGIEGIEGKAIAVGMDRPVPWKSPVEHGGAWFRNSGSPAGLKPKAVPEACAEMLSK